MASKCSYRVEPLHGRAVHRSCAGEEVSQREGCAFVFRIVLILYLFSSVASHLRASGLESGRIGTFVATDIKIGIYMALIPFVAGRIISQKSTLIYILNAYATSHSFGSGLWTTSAPNK